MIESAVVAERFAAGRLSTPHEVLIDDPSRRRAFLQSGATGVRARL
ncbi:hypothetical protein [Haloplanus rubicundus]|nr:hypothetical protein [Haloplanus rubicundus]